MTKVNTKLIFATEIAMHMTKTECVHVAKERHKHVACMVATIDETNYRTLEDDKTQRTQNAALTQMPLTYSSGSAFAYPWARAEKIHPFIHAENCILW